MRPASNDLPPELDGAHPGAGHRASAETTQLDETEHTDVEMQVCPPTGALHKAPLTEQRAVVVLDTNILLEFLDIIQTFVSDAEEHRLPVLIIIPGAVIHELDVQKNHKRLSWSARRASTWLLKKVKERKSVKGQGLDETCKTSGNWKVKEPGEEHGTERKNDGLILDCCQYFQWVKQCRTLLCSKDKLLAVEAESAGVRTLFPDERTFCSRNLALSIFGSDVSMLRFRGYQSNVMQGTAGRKEDDDEGMDVDDDSVMTEVVRPSHALDVLHLQVIEHFGELLLELVAKVAGAEADRFGAADATSRHAPAYARKQLMFWTTADSLEFLHTRKMCPRSSPRVEVFLLRPYEGNGARRGQDWSRRDWEVALDTLGRIGDMWAGAGAGAGAGIRASVRAAEAHMRPVFEGAGVS